MKKIALAAVAALIFAGQASADETIKVATAFDMLNALNMVTGTHQETVGVGRDQKVIQVPYRLDSDTFWALTDDIYALRKVVEAVQAEIRQMQQEAEAKNGGKAPQPGSPEQAALAASIQKLMDGERPMPKLFHVKRESLDQKENHFSGTVAASLEPILDR